LRPAGGAFEAATGIGASEFVDCPEALAADVLARVDARAVCDAAVRVAGGKAPLSPASGEGRSGPLNATAGGPVDLGGLAPAAAGRAHAIRQTMRAGEARIPRE
jgi:hypothetical protein